MKFFLDSARLDEIRYAMDFLRIDGVTTNPRHVQAAGKPFLTTLGEIARLVEGRPLTVSVEVNPHHAQAEAMAAEGQKLAALSPNFVIKLPATEAGFKAIVLLKERGIRANLTLVFSTVQALQAMRLGAFYVSPFIGWKEANGEPTAQLIEEIAAIRDQYGFTTEIIVAALRNGRQIVEAAVAGADIVTAGLAVYQEALDHPYTRDGLRKFQEFWDKTPYE